MELLGCSLEKIYLIGFGITFVVAILYVLFGDILEGIFHVHFDGFFNPTLIVNFVALFFASAFIFIKTTNFSEMFGFFMSLGISFVILSIVHVFILKPIRKAEETISYSLDDLIGQNAEVSIAIPVDGFGEVVIVKNTGVISRIAKSENNTNIKESTKVFISGLEDGVLIVRMMDEQ